MEFLPDDTALAALENLLSRSVIALLIPSQIRLQAKKTNIS
jgi:hypothetical protein